MSQVILITSAHYQVLNAHHFPSHKWPKNLSAHYQALNAHHFPSHKWPKNLSFTADQIRFAADENHQLNLQKSNFVKSLPLYFSVKQ